MKCTRCQKRPAVKDSQLGWLPCKVCQKEEESFERPELGHEFTTDSIRDQRLEYRRDILQPWHDGVLSKEYIEEYGTTGVVATEEQVKNAKYTYKGIKGWWNREKSKGAKNSRKSQKFSTS